MVIPMPAQSLDLLAGLDIRQPDATGSGFYVDSSGAILTAMGNVNACTRVTIDLDYDAEVAAMDNTLGYALLRPINALAPISVAQLLTNSPRINSEIALAGYSYGGLLGSPTLTYGTLADLRGLNGDTSPEQTGNCRIPWRCWWASLFRGWCCFGDAFTNRYRQQPTLA